MTESLVGRVVNFYRKQSVVLVELGEQLKVGDVVHFKPSKKQGKKIGFVQEVASMRNEHNQITSAEPGEKVTIEVSNHVTRGYEVYKKVESRNFIISLMDNGTHSFNRGLKSFEEFQKTRDSMLLKEAIMFLHHGIELLMKAILAKKNEYLIFEEFKGLPKMLKKAKLEEKNIFFMDNAPRTVGYKEALDRVELLLKPDELLDEDQPLRTHLEVLNNYRNQLEHYAINEEDIEGVIKILASIHTPIYNLFEKLELDLSQLRTPEANKAWKHIESAARPLGEVIRLLEKFHGQKMPGSLFNTAGEMTLPKFNMASAIEFRVHLHRVIRIFAEEVESGNVSLWIIGIVASTQFTDQDYHRFAFIFERIIEQEFTGLDSHRLVYASEQPTKGSNVENKAPSLSTIWLVAPNVRVPTSIRSMVELSHILVTERDEWNQLKKLLKEQA